MKIPGPVSTLAMLSSAYYFILSSLSQRAGDTDIAIYQVLTAIFFFHLSKELEKAIK